VLWKLFGPKREEVTGNWRRLHNEELYDLHTPPNVIWVIKSKRMRRWGGGPGDMHEGEERCIQGFGGET
jgi:hypothetical protein